MGELRAKGTERKKKYTAQTEKDAQNAWIKIIHIGSAKYIYANYYKNYYKMRIYGTAGHGICHI